MVKLWFIMVYSDMARYYKVMISDLYHVLYVYISKLSRIYKNELFGGDDGTIYPTIDYK